MPLYHFATTDLPGDTIAPEMSDINATASLKADAQFTGEDLSAGGYVDEMIIGKYLAYLAGIGFLKLLSGKGRKSLPEVKISPEQKTALLTVGGRGALV
jgi:L-aminoadipate-semialdehyde dehydrogenase